MLLEVLEVLARVRSMAKMGFEAAETVYVNSEYQMNSSVIVSFLFVRPRLVMVGRSNLPLFVSFESIVVGTLRQISGSSLLD